jgi:hypothetical protein
MPKLFSQAQGSALPTEVADGTLIAAATDEFGVLHHRDEIRAAAEQGTYYRAVNSTLGTGIAMGIQTAFSDTANVLAILRNTSSTKKIIPHYIRLICTVAGATTTSSRAALITDVINRYTSGGTDLTANIVNSATNAANASIADLKFGALTAAAVSAKRQIANMSLKTQAAPCWTAGDEVTFRFADGVDSQTTNGAATISITKYVGPCVLAGLNHSLLLHMWNVANATTAPSWEIEAAWWER